MIILRQKNYSINKKTAAEIAGKLTKLGIIGAGLGTGVGIGVSAIKKHKKRHEDLEERLEKLELNRLGQETDKDIREAVKGTKAESKVEKILDKSTKEMKKAAQKEYAAISDSGEVTMKTRDALEKARELGYTKKAAVKAAKRFLDKSRDDMNDWNKGVKKAKERLTTRPRMGFIKDRIKDFEEVSERAKDSRIGFRPDWTETKGSSVKLGFKKFSKQDREVVPADIVKKVKDGGGVIQKDHNGDWRIISMKTNPPTFWNAHYDSKALASKALGGYFANKH